MPMHIFKYAKPKFSQLNEGRLSYFSVRSQSTHIESIMSDIVHIICGVPQGSGLSVSVSDSLIAESSKVRDLGVIFDQFLNFGDYISGVCRSAFL